MSGVPGPANWGSSPLGTVCTRSPIASVATGPASTRRGPQSRPTLLAAIPRNARRFIAGSFRVLPNVLRRRPIQSASIARSLHRPEIATAFRDRGLAREDLIQLRRECRGGYGTDVLVADPPPSIDDERLRYAVDAVVHRDLAARVYAVRVCDAELVKERSRG